MKWAIGWHPSKDTIILMSKDIGTYAYAIRNNQLTTMQITAEIDSLSTRIFEVKYKK
jgi:hypothetical protein